MHRSRACSLWDCSLPTVHLSIARDVTQRIACYSVGAFYNSPIVSPELQRFRSTFLRVHCVWITVRFDSSKVNLIGALSAGPAIEVMGRAGGWNLIICHVAEFPSVMGVLKVNGCKNKELNITNPEPVDGKTNEQVFNWNWTKSEL